MFKGLIYLLFNNQTLRQTVIKNTFWLTVANVAGRAIRAIIVIYAARVLGAEGYGVFSYALGFSAPFIGFSDLGIAGILSRELSKGLGRGQKIIATSFFIKLTLTLATYIAALIGAFTVMPVAAAKIIIPLISLSLALDGFREFGFGVTRSFQKMEIEAGVTVAYQIGSVIVGFAALLLWKTPLSLALAYAFGSALGVILIARYLKEYLRNIRANFDPVLVKSILYDAWPFAITAFGNLILLYTDTIFLGWMKAEVDVGYYNAASKILQLMNLVPNLFIYALFPTLTQRIMTKEAKPLIEKSFALMVLLGLPIAVGGFLMPEFIINLVFGKEYELAIPIFRILILLTAISFPVAIVGYSLLAHNRQAYVVKYTLGAAALNLVLNYFFIRSFGNPGAALATVLAQSIMFFGPLRELMKVEHLELLKPLWRILMSVAIMAGIIILLKTPALPPIPIFLSAVLPVHPGT